MMSGEVRDATDQTAVLVTGGAQGIGYAIAKRFAAARCHVILVDRDAKALQSASRELYRTVGCRTSAVRLDVADVQSIQADLVEWIGDERITLRAVVNNVAAAHIRTMAALSSQEWDETLEVSLTAAFNIVRLLWFAIRKPGGAIVNVSSIHGQRTLLGHTAYSAAKAGLEGFTRAAAIDAAEFGVRVNCVAPGFIATGWVRREQRMQGERLKRIAGRVPLARIGEPSEVADVVFWLSSDAASYVTGAVVPVDGGLSAYAGETPE